MIEYRISKRSCNKDEFNKAADDYNEALRNCGYTKRIEYKEEEKECGEKRKKKNRKRKLIWFNPPFSRNVKTNIGKIFINLVKKHFETKNPLSKIINKKNMKISYSCMENIKSIIKKHNKKILESNRKEEIPPCNCRNKNNCPLKGGQCRQKDVVYSATVSTEEEKHTYIGLSSTEFKDRYASHKSSFNCNPDDKDFEKKKNATELSKLVWRLKDENTGYSIEWKIVATAKSAGIGSSMCNLCLKEALIILKNKGKCINKRTEMMNKCRHQNKYLLKNWKKAKKDGKTKR